MTPRSVDEAAGGERVPENASSVDAPEMSTTDPRTASAPSVEEAVERPRDEVLFDASARALRESEVRFRELADNISQLVWTADPAGWVYWYNKRWLEYTGSTLGEMQGWGWREVHHPEHVERVVRRMQQSFEAGTPWEDTFPLRGWDGSYRWFLSRALPIRNEAGNVVRWFGTNTDVTEQIEAEQALRELNETLEQRVEAETRERLHLWNVSQDLLAVSDMEGRYLSVNPAWTAALGWTEPDLLGQSSEWLVHPDEVERTRAELRHLRAGRKTLRFECRLRHVDGSYRWMSWRAVSDRGRIYALGRDIAELKDAEDRLREAQRELAHIARRTALAAMTGSIAHEVNQPLAAIVANGNASLRWLENAEPDLDEVRSALEQIVSEGHRASGIIANVRAMFLKEGHAGEPLDVNELVHDVLALVQAELDYHRISVQRQLQDDLPRVVAERVPLQQVLLNLIMNAVDAMSALEDEPRQLSVTTRAGDSDQVLILVADSGAGIDPGDRKRIFEAFFTTKSQGMGMGLFICRSIVEAHRGRVWAEPAAPRGTVFHVQLPTRG